MGDSTLLSILAEDKFAIAYRPRFAALTGDPLAAILLQQIIQWWVNKGNKPFYKFRDVCNHDLYREGDSWCEELVWNTYDFDKALKVIGTKITQGVKKQAVLDTDLPSRLAEDTDQTFYIKLAAALRCVVIYWTDSNRVTWYQVNENLLGKFLSQIYLDKSYGLKYLEKPALANTQVNRKVKFTFDSETNTETTTETNTKKKEKESFTPEGVSFSASIPTSQEHKSPDPFTPFIENELSFDEPTVEKPVTVIRESIPTAVEENPYTTRPVLQKAVIRFFKFNEPQSPNDWSYLNLMVNFFIGQVKPDNKSKSWFDHQLPDPFDAIDILALKMWYTDQYPESSPLRKPETIANYAAAFRMAPKREYWRKKATVSLNLMLHPPPPPPPKSEDEEMATPEEIEAAFAEAYSVFKVVK